MINVKQIGKPKSGGGSVTTNVQIGGSGGYEQLYQSLAGKVDTEFFKRLFGAIGADGAEMEVNDADTEVASLRVKTGVWTNEFVSALGLGDGSGGGSGGGVDILLSWDEYSDDKAGWALSAKLGKELLDMIGGDGPGDGFAPLDIHAAVDVGLEAVCREELPEGFGHLFGTCCNLTA